MRSGLTGLLTEVEGQGGRVKQKQLELKSRVDDRDLDTQTTKLHKWLQKGNFVIINIKTAKRSDKKDAEAVKAKIEAKVAEWTRDGGEEELVGWSSARLKIIVK